ncbi:hypothetical protein Tco_0713137, partial [Tanacetum coccineum]
TMIQRSWMGYTPCVVLSKRSRVRNWLRPVLLIATSAPRGCHVVTRGMWVLLLPRSSGCPMIACHVAVLTCQKVQVAGTRLQRCQPIIGARWQECRTTGQSERDTCTR